jgi:putative transposase
VYYHFRVWRDDALIAKINDVLRRKVRVLEGRDPEPSAAIIDGGFWRSVHHPNVHLTPEPLDSQHDAGGALIG